MAFKFLKEFLKTTSNPTQAAKSDNLIIPIKTSVDVALKILFSKHVYGLLCVNFYLKHLHIFIHLILLSTSALGTTIHVCTELYPDPQ